MPVFQGALLLPRWGVTAGDGLFRQPVVQFGFELHCQVYALPYLGTAGLLCLLLQGRSLSFV